MSTDSLDYSKDETHCKNEPTCLTGPLRTLSVGWDQHPVDSSEELPPLRFDPGISTPPQSVHFCRLPRVEED